MSENDAIVWPIETTQAPAGDIMMKLPPRAAIPGGASGQPSLAIGILPGRAGGGGGPSPDGRASPSFAGGGLAGAADSFIFGPLLLTSRAYIGISLVSWWRTALKRSARRFCSMTLTCSLVAPSGILAVMSNRSESSHSGAPEI